MGVSESRSAAKIKLDELEYRSRGASTEPGRADDALIELARRLAPRHSSPYPQAVSENGRTDTGLTTQPLETAKLPPSNGETSGELSKTAFVDVEAKQAFEFEDPYSYDPKQGRSGGRKLKISALALAGLAMIGTVFALKSGVPARLRRRPSSLKPRVRSKCSRRVTRPSRLRAMSAQPSRTKESSRRSTSLPFPQNNRRALIQRLGKVLSYRR
jgi:hypothetical protein